MGDYINDYGPMFWSMASMLIGMENVTGFVRAADGQDFTSLMTVLTSVRDT